uniref:Uncharacterized protein n=1 Tax=Anguilla anguilla TaxID=7936 RepID=A0A0E9VBA9_ANGAN
MRLKLRCAVSPLYKTMFLFDLDSFRFAFYMRANIFVAK